MEKPNFVRHGMLRLPPGFRFHPTDEELVVQYLERKAYSCPLPASIIPEIDFKNYNPWELPGGREEVRYFFSLRESKYRYQNRSNRAAGSGYWKATGKEKAVMASRCNQVVGMKKVLVFYRGKPKTRTDWIMHEYRLAGPTTNSNIFPQRNNSTHNFMVPSGDWVLCRIFKKKRAARKENEIEDDEQARTRSENTILIDLMRLRDDDDRRPLPPSSSESSCVTELSDGSSDGDEANSTRRSSPP